MFEAYRPHDYTVNFFRTDSVRAQKSRPKSKIRHPIPKISAKQKLANKLYEAAKRKWRKIRESVDSFRCEVVLEGVRCTNRAARNPHHVKGRLGKLLYDIANFLACCQGCHDYIHANPKWAYEQGYLKLRT